MDDIKNKLKTLLFDTESEFYQELEGKKQVSVYALLDSARNRDISDYIDIYEPEYRCLYWGVLEQRLFNVAPYIVKLAPEDDEFTGWVLENCYGDSQVMFLISSKDIDAITEHLRRYVIVDADQSDLNNNEVEIGDHSQKHEKALFAFYDPRVFDGWRLKLTKEEANDFFKQFEVLISENPENTDELIGYSLNPGNWNMKVIDLQAEQKSETLPAKKQEAI